LFSLQSYLSTQGATAEKISSALNAELLVQYGILKQISSRGKISALKELVEDIMLTNDKVIIGCWFNDTVQAIKDALLEYHPVTICGRIDGKEMTDDQINENKWRFNQNPKHRIIIVTYGKGSEGHNLGAADHVILPELGWTWKDQGQIEDRPVVVGKAKDIMVTYLLGKDTVDENIYNIIMSRKEISKQATGGKEDTETTFSILTRQMKDKFAK
jgi:SWI/SNF-related matrix-associated actin-dependent regulator 1 of chromatin subfamily A